MAGSDLREPRYFTPLSEELRECLETVRKKFTSLEDMAEHIEMHHDSWRQILKGKVVSDLTLDNILTKSGSEYNIRDFPWYRRTGTFKMEDGSSQLFYTPVDIWHGPATDLGEKVILT